MLEVLGREMRGNPLLLGPDGAGKTALVKRLARCFASGNVPSFLAGKGLYNLRYPAVKDIFVNFIKELSSRDNPPLLFIDEFHRVTKDVSTVENIKSYLGPDKIQIIGATTELACREEISDSVFFQRYFETITVNPMEENQTMAVLKRFVREEERKYGLQITNEALKSSVSLSRRFLRQRNFPEKAISVLDNAVGRARKDKIQTIDKSMVKEVVSKMVGVPFVIGDNLESFLENIPKIVPQKVPVARQDCEKLKTHLQVTVQNFDKKWIRPDATVLFKGTGDQTREFCRALATALYDDSRRVLIEDMEKYQKKSELEKYTMSPGSGDFLNPSGFLAELSRQPWTVVFFENFHRADEAVRREVNEFICTGTIKDGRGRRHYLSDAVVVLNLPPGEELTAKLFDRQNTLSPLLITPLKEDKDWLKGWLENEILADLAERVWDRFAVKIAWEKEVLEWLLDKKIPAGARERWFDLVDHEIGIPLVNYIQTNDLSTYARLKIIFKKGKLYFSVDKDIIIHPDPSRILSPTPGKRRTRLIVKITRGIKPREVPPLIKGGVDVVRLNLAYHSIEHQTQEIKRIKEGIRLAEGNLSIMASLPGPKIRLSPLSGKEQDETLHLISGDKIRLFPAPNNKDIPASKENCKTLTVSYPGLLDDLGAGETVYLKDGLIELTVQELKSDHALLEVNRGGEVEGSWGLNLPETNLSVMVPTKQDRKLIETHARELDLISVSFVREASEIREVRAILKEIGAKPRVIAKIETPRGLNNLRSIAREADAVMAAQGDLAVEIGFNNLPHAVRRINALGNEFGTPTIVATGVLQSICEGREFSRTDRDHLYSLIKEQRVEGIMLDGELIHQEDYIARLREINKSIVAIEEQALKM